MAFSPMNSHPTQRDTASIVRLEVPELAYLTLLPAESKNTEELDFDKTEVVSFFKKKNCKVLMCFAVMSNLSGLTISVLDTGVGSDLVRMTFLPSK